MNGWAPGVTHVLSMGTERVVVIKSRLVCKRCPAAKPGKKDRCFSTLHPHIVAQLRSDLMPLVGISVTERTVTDVSVIRAMQCARPHGVSMELFSMMCAAIRHGAFYDRMLSYYTACAQVKKIMPSFEAREFGAFNEGYGGVAPGSKRYTAVWSRDCLRRRAISLLNLGAVGGEYLKIDHTHWACKFVHDSKRRNMFNALFGVMNEHNKVISCVFLIVPKCLSCYR